MAHAHGGAPGHAGLFRSFWLAGFESACHTNRAGQCLDMVAATQHDARVDEDYALLRQIGIRTARDGVRWPLVEPSPGRYDFSSLAPMLDAAKRRGVQVIWTLCHYGWPADLDIFSAAFVDRFARYCRAVARFVRDQGDEVPFYTPINEISFLAWAAGDVAYIQPCHQGRGLELKRQLVRAAIAGIEAIWEVDPRARIAHVDPVISVVTPRARPELEAKARHQHEGQFESWDMLCGRRDPHLGGAMKYLDIMGLNFYHANQWEHPGDGAEDRLRWEDTPRDPRWVPLHRLIGMVYERYRRPIFIAETSHFGVGRGPWIAEVGEEVRAALAAGIPLEGVCLYPILDRPDWDNEHHWHNSGLWDLERQPDGSLRRVLCQPYYEALAQAMRTVESYRAAA